MGFAHLQQKTAKEIATCCIDLLPTLCTHLENCHNHFQVHTRFHSQPCKQVNYVLCLNVFVHTDYSLWASGCCWCSWCGREGTAAHVFSLSAATASATHHVQLVSPDLLAVSWICWQLQTFLTIFNHLLFIFRAGFSGLEHRALLKSALGVLASRLKEDETDLTLDQLSRWERQCTHFLFAVSGGYAV